MSLRSRHAVISIAAFSSLTLATAGSAEADGSKVLVLQVDGRADGKTKSKINAAVVKLAKSSGDQISPGDITYNDAAAAVGCKPDEASCKDEVLGMLSVDEIVITNLTPKPGGYEVTVRRVTKGGVSRDAQTFVAKDKPDQLEALAPLFQPPPPPPEPPKVDPIEKPMEPAPKPVAEPPPAVEPITAPPPRDEGPRRSKLPLVGIGAGATMFVVGAVLWNKASSLQSDIDSAPDRTRADLIALQDLESSADSYATWGNVLVVGGVVVAGVSTYFFFRGRRNRGTTSAQLVPVMLDGGAGVVLTVGGTR